MTNIVIRKSIGGPDLVTAIRADSAALLAYGLESFVDLWASALVLWRFWDDADSAAGLKHNSDREERANIGIAATVNGAHFYHWVLPSRSNVWTWHIAVELSAFGGA